MAVQYEVREAEEAKIHKIIRCFDFKVTTVFTASLPIAGYAQKLYDDLTFKLASMSVSLEPI